MSEFDEWFKSLNEGGRATYFLGQEGNISKEAWNHQQAKIDEFKKLRSIDEMAINQLAQANQVWQIKCDELQARVDGALKSADINFWNSSTVKDMVDILKGNKDEN